MYALPRTPLGRRALWLMLPVLIYLLLPVSLVIPDSWRAVSIAVVVAIIVLAVASLVTAGLAVFRERERSVILIVGASLTFVLVVTYAVGEAFGGH